MSRNSRIGGGGTKLPRNRPHSSNCASHSLSLTSVFRPGTRFSASMLISNSSNASSST